MTYKIGDKLKLLTDFYEDETYSQNVSKGSVLDVVKVCRTKGQWIDQTSVELHYLSPPYNHDNEFKLVDEDKVKNKFAVGDRVILANPQAASGHELEEGWIGYVIDPNDGIGDVSVQVGTEESDLDYYWFNEDELELLSVGKKEEPLAEYLVDMFSKSDPTLEEAVNNLNNMIKEEHTSPIKSDGGSSSYYDLPVPEWLLSELFDREIATNGKPYIKTEEIIAAFFGNDFDYANIIKCLVRVKGLQDKTGGKAGNSVDYECNKMKYSVEKIRGKR